ncbi:MAG: SGNH/GDSL hydrolase family protein [Bacteroidia bacterium]
MLKLTVTCIIASCMVFFTDSKKSTAPAVKYIALGDSYTIGTGADPGEAWPSVLTKHLNEAGIKTELVANPSRNGFSTQNLIDSELPVFDKADVNFVTLLIGVNDWVRNVPTETYHKNLIFILDHVLKKLIDKKRLVLVTIPDFGVTPQGALYGSGRNISNGISEFNDIIKAEAEKRKLVCVDIFELSKSMKDNPGLIAEDGLHPSAREYSEWEKLIFPAVQTLLEK